MLPEAYFGATITCIMQRQLLDRGSSGPASAVGLIGIVFERLILRRLAGNVQGQVLVTLGVSFIIADLCLMIWTGDPVDPMPAARRRAASTHSAWRLCVPDFFRLRWCSASRW